MQARLTHSTRNASSKHTWRSHSSSGDVKRNSSRRRNVGRCPTCGAGSTETLAFAAAMVFDLQVGRLLKQPAGWNGVISTLLAFSVGAAVLVAVFMQQEKRLEDKMLAS